MLNDPRTTELELAHLFNLGDQRSADDLRRLAQLHEEYFADPQQAAVWRSRAEALSSTTSSVTPVIATG